MRSFALVCLALAGGTKKSLGFDLTLVGGTGKLGIEVSKGLATAKGYDNYVALVRSSADTKRTQTLADNGWTVREVDFDNSENLQKSLRNSKTVVSTLAGDQFLNVETKTMDAAKASGVVEVYVPSQFGMDLRRWSNFHPFLDVKNQILAHAKSIDLATLIVNNGGFSDQFMELTTDIRGKEKKAILVDGGMAPFSFTKRSDVGLVLARALADPEYANGGHLSMQADTMPYRDAVALLEKAIGQEIALTNVSLQEWQEHEQEALQTFMASNGEDINAFFQSFAAHILSRPAAGDTGLDVSAGSKTYGVEMESVEATFQAVYGQ